MVERFLEVEEKTFLLKNKLFELLRLVGTIERDIEKIANENYYEDE
jgi:hypothetical protein